MKLLAHNKKASYDYEILDRIETGIVLTGDEVKSLRAGHINLTGAYGHIHKNELYLINANIAPYSHAYDKRSEPQSMRNRKLLVHRRELVRIMNDIARKGVVLVPLKIYFNEKGRVKLELGICKHKKAHERKEDIKERDIQRETRRELKGTYRY